MCDLISREGVLHELDWCDYELKDWQRCKLKTMVRDMPSAQKKGEWIPCSEWLPECEQEVLICTEKKLLGQDAYIDSIVTPALYEDGTMLEVESKWHWEDIDWEDWNDEEDCGIIPEGWWENRHFNQDDVYNNPVDRKVIAWMPLPEPYSGADMRGEHENDHD